MVTGKISDFLSLLLFLKSLVTVTNGGLVQTFTFLE